MFARVVSRWHVDDLSQRRRYHHEAMAAATHRHSHGAMNLNISTSKFYFSSSSLKNQRRHEQCESGRRDARCSGRGRRFSGSRATQKEFAASISHTGALKFAIRLHRHTGANGVAIASRQICIAITFCVCVAMWCACVVSQACGKRCGCFAITRASHQHFFFFWNKSVSAICILFFFICSYLD